MIYANKLKILVKILNLVLEFYPYKSITSLGLSIIPHYPNIIFNN
jgi:hypothetical protein